MPLINNFFDKLKPTVGSLALAGSLITGGYALARVYQQISNDVRRKSLVEDLYLNDPVLKELGKAQIMEWYATIMHFAPKFSLNKTSVREVLHSFARFGKVDINTLKMLSEVEKNTAAADASVAKVDGLPWTSLLGQAAGGALGSWVSTR